MKLKNELEERKSELDYENASENDNQDLLAEINKVQKDIERLKGRGQQSPSIENEIRVLN